MKCLIDLIHFEGLLFFFVCLFLAQMITNLPAIQETQVQSLDQEDNPEKGMTTHSSILAWRIPRTEEPGGLQSMGSQRVRHDWATNTSTFTLGAILRRDGSLCRILFCSLSRWVSPLFLYWHSTKTRVEEYECMESVNQTTRLLDTFLISVFSVSIL